MGHSARVQTASSATIWQREPSADRDPTVGSPGWIDSATIYGVSVGHVNPAGLQGVIAHLDNLADLGIDAVWLSPVNASPPGDFGYAVVDFFDVRAEYGTRDDFRRLVREAHARNIRVLMDVVPNHTSSAHPWFQDAERNGAASRYRDFYDRDAHGNATHYFSWTHLPNLNYGHPEVRQIMTEAMLSWVRDADVDGFRIDVAWGIRQREPAFWPEFCASFRQLKPDGLLIAEASARDGYYADSGFDAAYDWTDALGQWAWEGIFERGEAIGSAIAEAVNASVPHTRVFRFLNNNDTGARFITRHGAGFYRVATAMLLTLPGLPCLYLGDEVGAAFEPYADHGSIARDDRHGVREHIRSLIALRHALPGLASRAWTPLAMEPADALFGYLRGDEASPVLVLLNFAGHTVTARLDPAGLPGPVRRATDWIDRLTGQRLSLDLSGPCAIPMGEWDARILVPAGEGDR